MKRVPNNSYSFKLSEEYSKGYVIGLALTIPLFLCGVLFGWFNQFCWPHLILIPVIGYFSAFRFPKSIDYWLIGILILAFAVRVLSIDTLPYGLWIDEARLGLDVRKIFHGDPFIYRGIHSPEITFVHQYYTYIFCWLFGETMWALRLPAAIAGVLTVVGTYCLGSVLDSAKTGRTAAFVLSIMMWHMVFSRFNMHTIMAPLFLVWMLWATCTKRPMLAGLLLGVGLYTHQSVAIGALLIPLFERRIRHLIPIYAIACVVASPLLGYYFREPELTTRRWNKTSLFNQPEPWKVLPISIKKHLYMLFGEGDLNARHGIPFAPRINIVMLVLLGIGLIWKWSFVIVTIYLVGLLPGIFSLPFEAPQSARSICSTVPVALLAGKGLSNIYNRIPNKLASRSIIGILCLLLVSINLYQYFIQFNNNPKVWREYMGINTQIAHTIESVNRDDVVVMCPNRIEDQTVYLIPDRKFAFYSLHQYEHVPWKELHDKQNNSEVHFVSENWMLPLPKEFWQWHYPGCQYIQHTDPAGEPTFYQVILQPGKYTIQEKEFPFGLRGVYRSLDSNLQKKTFIQIDPILNFRWHALPFETSPFEVKWQGYLQIKQEGTYSFRLNCEKSAIVNKLQIDNQEIINSNYNNEYAIGSIQLQAGKVPIEIEYRNRARPTLRLKWSTPDTTAFEVIPFQYLTHKI
jgi:hypothetical protein